MPYKDPEARRKYSRERAKRDRQDPAYVEYQRAYRERNAAKLRQQTKAWQDENRDRMRDYLLKYTYGVEVGTYERLLKEQDARCACCHTDRPGGRGRFHLDHCHQTGAVRGLLCFDCNVGIGKLGDSVEGLQRAISYLERVGTPQS